MKPDKKFELTGETQIIIDKSDYIFTLLPVQAFTY